MMASTPQKQKPKGPVLVPEKGCREPAVEFRHHDHVEPGEYLGYCRSADIHFDQNFRRWVCCLQFDVFAEDRTTLIAKLTKFFNLGTGDKPGARSRRRHYWIAWCKANGGRPPRRNDRMSPQLFVRRFARVQVVDVTKDVAGVVASDEMVYSKVSRILAWETGS
jgi:hypothetical protein